MSPFKEDAHFIEVDATICRFDERNIADPLIGSVHDPIYQGAGSMGAAGIPQPKPGACTRAHGGILFIDEIGELHPIQLNKLLKVLEDRKVILESAYYSETDHNIPSHIHDIFQKGLPADFRLIGATTRAPQELPPALRSRCMEIYFKPLEKESIKKISRRAAEKINFILEDDIVDEISRYANNGREAVNIVQLAAGIAMMEKSSSITAEIIQKVINNGRFSPRPEVKIKSAPAVGIVNGLAVTGANTGVIMEVEAMVMKAAAGTGQLTVTGVIDEEQVGGAERQYRRKSMARSAVENVMTVLASRYQLPIKDYDVHINFPGGIPIDGPSAGITMATAIYSAVHEIPIHHQLAMTGEISVYGMIKPVGGVISKLEAARAAGVKHVLIPADNYMDIFSSFPDIEVTPVHSLDEVFSSALVQ